MENGEVLPLRNAECIFLGNDKRMTFAAQALSNRGISVKLCSANYDIYGMPSIADKRFLIFPIPLSEKNFLDSIGCGVVKFCESIAKSNVSIVGVNADPSLSLAVRESGVELIDIGNNEEFLTENAYLTAEAAVSIIMHKSDSSIRSQNIALFGYGRISKFLLSILYSLKVKVSVYARRAEARSLALCDGAFYAAPLEACEMVSALEKNDVVINTVPYFLLGADVLSCVRARPYLMDRASLPGGIDVERARDLGYNASRELGLPAKHAPRDAGEAFARAIYSELF